MFTCKSVSKSLAKEDYQTLPWPKRAALKLHVWVCCVCGRYNKQVMQMQDTCRAFREQSAAQGEPIEAPLASSRKEALRARIKEQLTNGDFKEK